jgi:superfamily I DNA/RNA helicase
MLVVNALAGTGKTTTAMFGLGTPVPKGMVLSKEQLAIVKQMRSYSWEKAAAMAFNSSIADELKKRVPPGVEAATSNAFGYRAWLKHIDKKRIKVDAWKNRNILTDIGVDKGIDEDVIKQIAPDVDKLVSLCKGNMLTPDDGTLGELCDKFDIEPPNVSMCYDLVREVYEAGLKEFEYFDFDDQLFMPLHYNISIPKFDLVLVDEAQDLNPVKQELAFRMVKEKGNLVIIGDRHQAIYGFTGADSSSMDTMSTRMRALCVRGDGRRLSPFNELPLTVTRRCPKEVVKVANKYVPELKAHEEALDGEVRYIKQSGFVDELVADPIGRMILCRVNAPLTGLAFKLLRANRRCYIQGKDIGNGIKKILTKTKERLLVDAIPKGLEKLNARIVKLQTSSKPDTSKIESLEDQVLCIEYLTQDITTVDEFCDRVDMLFKDSGSSLDHQLSSVHKSKGLEKKHVCIYVPSKLPMLVKGKRTRRTTPGGSATPGYQLQQEYNLAYVAYTRAQEILTFVVEDEKERNYDYKRDNDD